MPYPENIPNQFYSRVDTDRELRYIPIKLLLTTPEINLIVMLCAKNIGKLFNELSVMSIFVRIIGLIIASIEIQLIFDSGIEFFKMHVLIKLL